jgi:hypothetical protein
MEYEWFTGVPEPGRLPSPKSQLKLEIAHVPLVGVDVLVNTTG